MSDDLLKEIYSGLDSLPRTIQKRTTYKAKLGNGQGVVKVANRPGFVYARLEQSSGSEVVTHVYAPGVRHINDNPVEVEINRHGFYQTVGVDPVAGQAFWNGYGTGEGGPHADSHGLHGDDRLWVDMRQITPLLVHPTNPPSLSVDMEPGLYRNLIGEWVHYIGGTIDLTSFMPTSLNEQRFAIVGLDRENEVATVITSATDSYNNYQPETVPFDGADVATLLNSDAGLYFEPKMAVRLAYGQTQIQQWDHFQDCREWSAELGINVLSEQGVVFHSPTVGSFVIRWHTTTTDPDVNADETVGYAYFSRWLNSTTLALWECLDPTDGAAVWRRIDRGYSTANISNPPTDAELDSAFGTPAANGAGFTAFLDDNNGGTNVYLVMTNGTNWYYTLMTQAS